MFTSYEKKRLTVAAVMCMLLLFTGYNSNAQIDSNAGKKQFTDTIIAWVKPKQKIIPFHFLSPVMPLNSHSFLNNKSFIQYPYHSINESNTSKTILRILGAGALSVFGDRTKHNYQPNNQQW